MKEIVVFANSVKHGQSCVAGKCTRTKKWIRPVSNVDGGEICENQTKILNLKNNSKWNLKILQKIQIGISCAAPLIHQPENYVITQEQWIDKFKISPQEALQYLDNPVDLWGQGNRISFSIQNKDIVISDSLYLIRVKNLNLYTSIDQEKKKRRGNFYYNSFQYDLASTAREFDNLIGSNKETTIEDAIICISLGENHNGNCYKLIASIINLSK